MCIRDSNKAKESKVKVGDVFGRWTVLYEVSGKIDSTNHKHRRFHCRCECGEEKDIALSSLITGSSEGCHKCGANKIKIKVGDVLGRWTVLYEADRYIDKRGKSYRVFHCRCECGLEKDVMLLHLNNGLSKSCKKCSIESHARKYRISKGVDPDIRMNARKDAERKVFSSTVRTKIYIRDNGKCQMCYKYAENVHHIIPWSDCHKPEDQQLRYDPENCIALCKECHLKAHNGNCNQLDDEIAEQLMTKAIENTKKHPKLFVGMTEEINKKLEEIS